MVNELVSLAHELCKWLGALEPSFAFLFVLPLIVVAAGLLRYWFDQARSREDGCLMLAEARREGADHGSA